MIQHFDITGVHFKIDSPLEEYLRKKLQHLDFYAPKRARQSLHAEVRLREQKAKVKGQKECECEVVLHLPKENIMVKESTVSMFASVDIVESKLKQKLRSYKDRHTPAKLRHHIAPKFRTTPVLEQE